MNMLKIWPAPNSCLAPTLQTCFEITINMRENNFNFGTTIYLKSRADRKAANRYELAIKNPRRTEYFEIEL